MLSSAAGSALALVPSKEQLNDPRHYRELQSISLKNNVALFRRAFNKAPMWIFTLLVVGLAVVTVRQLAPLSMELMPPSGLTAGSMVVLAMAAFVAKHVIVVLHEQLHALAARCLGGSTKIVYGSTKSVAFVNRNSVMLTDLVFTKGTFAIVALLPALLCASYLLVLCPNPLIAYTAGVFGFMFTLGMAGDIALLSLVDEGASGGLVYLYTDLVSGEHLRRFEKLPQYDAQES